MPSAALSLSASAALPDHEVVRAWLCAADPASIPASVEEIVKKRTVDAYRLRNAGVNSDVIAKRCDRCAAIVEQAVYDRILPMSGVPALRCYGRVDIESSDSCWLFIEDAGGEPFSASYNSGHIALAARWLASMHATAAGPARDAASVGKLPILDLQYYFDHLRQARERILDSVSVNPDAAAHRDLLEEIARQCDHIEHFSDVLQSVCATAPQTLNHGDFVAKNLRVCQIHGVQALRVFDWEVAGFGAPAVDIAQCDDLDAYAQVVNIPVIELRRVALAGKIFRWACAVDWKSHSLVYEQIESAFHVMRAYHSEMERLLVEVAAL